MRKLRVLLSLFVAVAIFAVAPVSGAQDFDPFGDVCSGNADATVCKDADTGESTIFGPDGVLTDVINILSIIIGVAAVIVIIIAGIQYMLSTGDPTKTNNAKNAIIYALVGLGVAVVARVVVAFVLQRL